MVWTREPPKLAAKDAMEAAASSATARYAGSFARVFTLARNTGANTSTWSASSARAASSARCASADAAADASASSSSPAIARSASPSTCAKNSSSKPRWSSGTLPCPGTCTPQARYASRTSSVVGPNMVRSSVRYTDSKGEVPLDPTM